MRDSLSPAPSRRLLPLGPVGIGVAVALAVVLLIAVVIPALFSMAGIILAVALLWIGAELIAERRAILGWAAVGVGGFMLVGRLPLLALLAGAGAIGWALARRS